MKRKKILIISDSDLRKSFIGRKHYLIKYLSINFDIIIFNPHLYWKEKNEEYRNYYKYSKECDVFLKNSLIINGYPIKIHDIYISEIFNFLPNYCLLFKIITKNKIDIILNFSNVTIGILLRLCRKKIPVILDLLDYRPGQVGFSTQSKLPLISYAQKYIEILQNYNIKYSEAIVACSEELRKYALYKSAKKVKLITNGVDMDLMHPFMNVRIKKNLGFSEKDFIIGYIGGVHWLLDLEMVFNVIQHFSNNKKEIKLLIVGDGSHLFQYIKLAEKMNILDKVKFVGRVGKFESPLYINSMDVGLIPFRKDNVAFYSFPLKILDYLACGKPVISSNIPALKKISKKDEFDKFIFYADDKETFVYILNEIIDKINDIKNPIHIQNIRNKLINFDWKSLAKEYYKFLLEVSKI